MRTKELQESPQVSLSVKELQKIGEDISSAVNTLEMHRLTLESLDIIRMHDTEAFLWIIKQFLDKAYTQTDKLAKKLDKAALLLLECDNEKELEELQA